jgi:hypothetical protein
MMSLSSCFNDDNNPKDWTETVNLYVSSEPASVKPLEGIEVEGMKIKEKEGAAWTVVGLSTISEFTYEKGYNYLLETEKTHLANPPADGSNISYKLVKIISKEAR